LPEPSWSQADERRRQQMLTEKRIAPVGQVKVAEKPETITSESETQFGLDKPIFLELIAGPPSPADEHILAP